MKALCMFPVWISGTILCLSSCKDDPKPVFQYPDDAIVITNAYDINNNSNGSDVRIDFVMASHDLTIKTAEIRCTLSQNQITLEQAKALEPDRFEIIANTFNGVSSKAKLSNSLAKDTQGNGLSNDIDYKAYILLVSKDETYFLSTPKDLTLKNRPVFAGAYTGLWNDALFQNFKVTMRLNDDYKGEIFYSGNFTTCCPVGGASDATVELILDGMAIISFKAMQYLGSYKGGHCEATYAATGVITDEVTLSISNLTGTDCDGNHTPGTIVFTRQ